MKTTTFSFLGQAAMVLAMGAMSWTGANARHLQPEEALSMLGAGQMKAATTHPLQLAFTLKAAGEATVYVFNHDGQPGFYVLAADDALGDIVLGYSDHGRFLADNIAPGMKWLLESYSAQVSSVAANGRPTASKKVPAGLAPVEPLISTVWDQNAPYNDMCPVVWGERSITGCVATAMAQVMKKFEWPVQGKGSYTYTTNGVQVSSDFSSHVYDWSNMIDNYCGVVEKEDGYYYEVIGSPEQNAAVAQLMFDCGVAAKMNYTPYSSGAVTINGATGMLEYFSYDKSMQYLMRDWYSEDDWMRLMHEQISQGLPVMYGGRSIEDYGHEFILDGYDGNGFFHFNWGWGGFDDGYFTLAAEAAPGTDITYVLEQDAIVNICPDKGSPFAPSMGIDGVFCTEDSEYDAQSGWVWFSVENGEGGFWSYALGTINYEIGAMNTLDGSVASITSATLQPYYGFTSFGTSTKNFPVGEYDVYLVCRSEGYDWTPLHHNVNTGTGRVHFVNDGTKITISEATDGEPEVDAVDIVLNSISVELFKDESFQLVAIVLPENATNPNVTWTTSNAEVATVDATGKVTAIDYGTAIITAACGKVSAACEVTVKPLDGASGLTAEGIVVSATVGCIHVQAPDDTEVAVYDASGKLCYRGTDRAIAVDSGKTYIVVAGDKAFKVKA